MWDPNETLGQWGREDDVLSWRSLDTLRGGEMDSYNIEHLNGEVDDFSSDTSDTDEPAELVERRPVNTIRFFGAAYPPVPVPDEQGQQQHSNTNDHKQHYHPPRDEAALRDELPSTSEMVRISEPPAHQKSPSDRIPTVSPAATTMSLNQAAKQQRDYGKPSSGDWHERVDWEQPPRVSLPTVDHESISNQLMRAATPPDTRRVAMTLGDLLAKKKAEATTTAPMEPLLHVHMLATTPATASSIDSNFHIQEMKTLELRCEELVGKEHNLRTVLARQLLQIENLTDQLQHKGSQVQMQQLELSGLKEKTAQLERQKSTLETAVREKQHAVEHHMQLVLQKTSELTDLENKVRSLQVANESYQEQAKKATDEKDKVHKDYLQVVFELGKLQKQMNAASKETVSIAEKDLLLREIDQLRHEKEQLHHKVRETEARKTLLLQSSAVAETQKVKELQTRVRELEDELVRTRNVQPLQPSYLQPPNRYAGGANDSMRQGYPPPPTAPPVTYPSPAPSWGQSDPSGMPSLLHSMSSNTPGRSMTLKDMMGDRRPPPPPTYPPSASAISSMSLASLGYSAAARRSSGVTGEGYEFEQFKADAVARRTSSISDVLKQQNAYDSGSNYSSSSSTAFANPALSAPFATEKQTMLHDSLQKRDLEQKLLKLHVEKEQMEAKMTKVEQTGLKTMSSRNEKSYLENHLRDLTIEISRLKLSLR